MSRGWVGKVKGTQASMAWLTSSPQLLTLCPQMLLFFFLFCAGLYFTLQLEVGLDQELALPEVTPDPQPAGAPHS